MTVGPVNPKWDGVEAIAALERCPLCNRDDVYKRWLRLDGMIFAACHSCVMPILRRWKHDPTAYQTIRQRVQNWLDMHALLQHTKAKNCEPEI